MRSMELAARILEAGRVRLEPFEEHHREGLAALAAAEPDIFRHMPFAIAEKGYGWWFDALRADQAAGRSIPHAVFARVSSPVYGGGSRELARDGGGDIAQMPASTAAHRPLSHAAHDSSPAGGGAKEKLIGQTCYLNIRPRDAGVEIGSTWYARAAQGTFVNPSCKLALIANAFEQGAERVELKTDALNAQSRAALLKLGATFEGIHRRHMRRADGTLRDTAWYSVIREEWRDVRAKLEARLAQ